MKRVKAHLTRNLRRQVLRGHPWIYKQAVSFKKNESEVSLCELNDSKGKFLSWCVYDPLSPLALRILSLEKKPPTEAFFKDLFLQAVKRREHFDRSQTNAFRLINGEGDRLPGFICDVYGEVAVVQFDGDGMKSFWSQFDLLKWLYEYSSFKTVVEKTRGDFKLIDGEPLSESVVIKENGISFAVDIVHGQKTGFFFDQRDNRNYVKSMASGKSVMNLFSYTGGFSVYAGVGGAKSVLSVDLAKPALDLAQKSWALNGLDASVHKVEAVDIFNFFQNHNQKWDMVVVDPPSMAHSESQKSGAVAKYTSLFAEAANLVNEGGDLILSSCSSHISFEDFFMIAADSLSQVRRKGVIMRVSGQGADHPFPHICPELRYLKFIHLNLE